MILEGVTHAYKVVRVLAVTKTYKLHFAQEVESGVWCVLQVASNRESNGGLERAAFVLDELAATSRRYDELYAPEHEGKRLHYDRLFPKKVESFVSEEQGKRRVNVLSFSDVSDARKLAPLSYPITKDRVILDLKSGAWVMGRLLKLLDFTHPLGIAVRTLGPNNILLERDKHYAIVLDWTDAFMFQGVVSAETAAADISRAAEAVLESCGVPDQGAPPFALEDGEDRYLAMMRGFANGQIDNAYDAHSLFYTTCHEALGNGFHPFTVRPLP